MRRTTWLATLTALALPVTAHAKGASLGDLVSELTLPAQIQPGETFDVAAKIDVEAFCARTTSFKGANCVADSTPGDSGELVLLPTSDTPETSDRIVQIWGQLVRQADGVYRGAFKTLPCQKDGAYGARSIDPNPALATARMVVASVATCTADKEASRVAAIHLPERVKVPDEIPHDNSTWPRGKLVVEVDDDASGPMQLDYILAPADERGTSYGGATILCQPCGSHWTCSADIPLCGVASLGDLAVVVTAITDRAGRLTTWSPVDAGPFAVVHCGTQNAADPILSCAAPPEVDAGVVTTTPDVDAGVTSSDGSPANMPSVAKNSAGSGCTVAPSSRNGGSLFLVVLGGLLVAMSRRSSRRSSRR